MLLVVVMMMADWLTCAVSMIDDVESGKRVVTRGGRAKKGMAEKDGHTGHILSVSVASDGNLVATAGRDKNIRIWDVRTRECVKVFTGHRDIVTVGGSYLLLASVHRELNRRICVFRYACCACTGRRFPSRFEPAVLVLA